MGEFRESSHLLSDEDALRKRLAEDGYLFFRSLVDPSEVDGVRKSAVDALGSHGWLADGSDLAEAIAGGGVSKEGDPNFFPAYSAIQSIEGFHKLAHNKKLIEILRKLLGGEVLVHPRKVARIGVPVDIAEFTTRAHQDFLYVQGSADVLTAWIPLGDCPRELGGLRVLAGSAGDGLLPVAKAEAGAATMEVEVADDDARWATADYKRGDVLVFHSLTVHAALPNHTNRLRLSADFRYQLASDPITPESLRPHYYPRVPEWEVLTQYWSSTAWVETSEEMTFATLDIERTEAGESRLISNPGSHTDGVGKA